MAKTESRMQFIPELREKIKANLVSQGVAPGIIDASFERWDAGEAPRTPHEMGCFEVFRTIQKQIG